MKTQITNGFTLPYTVPDGTTVASGDLVFAGTTPGIAVTDGAAGVDIVLNRVGVFNLAKGEGVISQGDKLYWDSDNSVVSTTFAKGKFVGICYESMATDTTEVLVLLGSIDMLPVAEEVAALGEVADLTAVPASFADEAAVKAYLDTLVSEVEARLDAIEAKVDALIASFQASGQMAVTE